MNAASAIEIEKPDWRSYFAGAWRLTRRIIDKRDSHNGEAGGEAVFTTDGNDEAASLICKEKMTIDYGGRRWPADQMMIWRFDGESGPRLYFRDGRFFCEMPLTRDGNGWRAEFVHLCGEDRYEGAVHIVSDSTWRLIWRVHGPRKDYQLETDYQRLAPEK